MLFIMRKITAPSGCRNVFTEATELQLRHSITGQSGAYSHLRLTPAMGRGRGLWTWKAKGASEREAAMGVAYHTNMRPSAAYATRHGHAILMQGSSSMLSSNNALMGQQSLITCPDHIIHRIKLPHHSMLV